MVETITPVVHGGRRGRWGAALALHVAGAAASAGAVGAVLGGVGGLLGGPWGGAGPVLVLLAALAYAARELIGLPVPVPERRAQVPERWRSLFGPSSASFLYGLGLGVGFLTHLRHGTLAAAGTAAFVTGDPVVGAVVMLGFGVARSLAVSVVGRARTTPEVSRVVDALERLGAGRAPVLTNAAALLLLAAAAAAAAGGTPDPPWGGLGAALLAVVFASAAGAKVLRPGRWREALRGYRPGVLEPAAALGVPALEAAVPALVLLGRPRLAALTALGLLAVFSAGVLRAKRLAGARLPCGCFGGTRRRDYRFLLARNGALTLLSAAALIGSKPATAPGLRLPAPGEALPAAMVVLGLAAVALVAREVARAERPRAPER